MAHRGSIYAPNREADRPSFHSRNGSASGPAFHNRTDSQSRSRAGTPVGTFPQKFVNSLHNREGSGSFGNSQRNSSLMVQPSGGPPNGTQYSDDDRVDGIEGENDFSGRKYVWLPDPEKAFIKGWVTDEDDSGVIVDTEDGRRLTVNSSQLEQVNPAKFDKADDMAELTFLNEASVIHNLRVRYTSDLIYTYSGLFLVTVNPYRNIPIYGKEYISMYRGRSRDETRPHIFAVADEAFRNLVSEGQHQSILVTGESGAGKTENTKKVIQYLAAVAVSPSSSTTTLSQQILQANPILEAFGNAQTVKNNNSSRFGKFIRIEFTRSGMIAGAYIDWFLLEKSRVVKVGSGERNYHIFYQLLRGADSGMRKDFLLENYGISDFEYTRHGNSTIAGVSDVDELGALKEAFSVMGFTREEQYSILATVVSVLHLGNVLINNRGEQATLTEAAESWLFRACHLLGVQTEDFARALLRPRVKAGREVVEKAQTAQQAKLALDALAKGIYERTFGNLVDKINRSLDHRASTVDVDGGSNFIGVLDIAGFEIFKHNSFEQLCINYTNEKLQQFFNHHMFVLEQDEYAREQIEWEFIDFGKDLQPTIDLIELPNPIGIFSCLDEDSVMPKATDASFTEKLHSLWDKKSNQYRRNMLGQGFMLTHYAATVEYSTEGWLEKNKDPMNDNITALLSASKNPHVAGLFYDCSPPEDDAIRSRVKKGLFRTVAQRHKEQLGKFMTQLHTTHPHFVRCILPNLHKRGRLFEGPLVLDQLRCNGVLEGIRIARTGFPNRLPFNDFRSRYGVLATAPGERVAELPLDPGEFARTVLARTDLDPTLYRVGLSKVFFRAGVLAELEAKRDALISAIVGRFQCVARGFMARRTVHKLLYRAEASRVIQRSLRTYQALQYSAWWSLFVRMRPLLGASRQAKEIKIRDDAIKEIEAKMASEVEERVKIDNERRRAEDEISRITQTLEAERALALDKDEIFRRLQAREAELKDRLHDVVVQVQEMEGEIEQAATERNIAEKDAEVAREELQNAQILLERLRDENGILEEQLSALAQRLAHAEDATLKTQDTTQGLRDDISHAKSKLSLKEKQVEKLEARLLEMEQIRDVQEAKLNKAVAAHESESREAAQATAAEISKLRGQLSELSATSDSFSDLLRQKDSELAVAKSEISRYADDRAAFDKKQRQLATRHDELQSQLRDAQAQVQAAKSQLQRAENDAADARRMLENHADAAEKKQLVEQQLVALQKELFEAQRDLAKERQSRDDVQMLAEHQLSNLQRDLEALAEAKVTIEKEMYTQQDILRRAVSARTDAEQDRNELRTELRNLREQYLALQAAKVELETDAERAAAAAAQSRAAFLRSELASRDEQLAAASSQRANLEEQIVNLRRAVGELSSDIQRQKLEEERERLSRELQLVRSRLTASENDNRVLMNRIQQQRLDIAKVGDRTEKERVDGRGQRETVEKLTRAEEQIHRLRTELEASQSKAAAMETQRARLQMDVDDLNGRLKRKGPEGNDSSLVRSRAAKFDSLVRAEPPNDHHALAEEREMIINAYKDAVTEISNLQARLEEESSQAADVSASLNLYKARADDHLARLEQAEIAVLKASRAEQFARAQAKEADEIAAVALSERARLEVSAEDLARRAQRAEARAEDLSADLDSALQIKKRLQQELDDYRSQHALDLEDTATSTEQTRQKYQAEMAALHSQLASEREDAVQVREQNSRLKEEMADMRAKWDAEAVNSTSWAKEKSRLEVAALELTRARNEAMAAQDESQAKIVDLLGQVRGLRSQLDTAIQSRDDLVSEKTKLSSQLADANGRLDELAKWSESPSVRSAAATEKTVLELQASLSAQEDIVTAAVNKMRRAETLAAETQRDIAAERETNVQLHKDRAALQSTVRDLQLKLVDFETKGLTNAGGDVRFLHSRIQDLERDLEQALSSSAKSAKSSRDTDRTVRELQTLIDRREKQNEGLSDDLARSRERIHKLLSAIDDLQTSESSSQLIAKRAERELREARDRISRLEKDLDSWRNRGSRNPSYLRPVSQLLAAQGERESSPAATVVASRAIRGVRGGSVPIADERERDRSGSIVVRELKDEGGKGFL